MARHLAVCAPEHDEGSRADPLVQLHIEAEGAQVYWLFVEGREAATHGSVRLHGAGGRSYDEILQELLLNRMIEQGLADVEAGRTFSEEEMARTIESWRG